MKGTKYKVASYKLDGKTAGHFVGRMALANEEGIHTKATSKSAPAAVPCQAHEKGEAFLW